MRAWMFGLTAAALTLAPAAGQDKDKIDTVAVIKKAIDAHGGADVLNKYKAGEYDVKGRMALPGLETDFTGKVAYQLPDKYRMTLDMDVGGMKMTLTQVTSGKDVKTTLNGKDQKIPDAQRAEAVQAATMQEITQLTPLLDAKRYTLKADKDADVGGMKASAVTVSREGMKDVTLYFDQKTGRLVQTTRKGLSPEEKEVTEVSTLSDFKKVDGMLIPMQIEVTHDGKKFMSLTITAAKMLEKADPSLFPKADAGKDKEKD